MKAHFLRHEGYLGAVGAFLSVHPLADSTAPAAPAAAAPIMAVDAADREPGKVRCRHSLLSHGLDLVHRIGGHVCRSDVARSDTDL